MKKISILLFLLGSFSPLWAQEVEVAGRIYLDQNNNGKWDSSEPTLRKVLVSDGKQITKTNRRGKFKITTQVGQQIFPILPSGYTHSNESWWNTPDQTSSQSNKSPILEFGLQALPEAAQFKALIIGDIQVDDTKELSYADRTILKELRSRSDYDFSIFLGDLVNDEPSLLPPLRDMLAELEKPAFVVYGNHDRNAALSHDNQTLDFNSSFGPETYAFYRNDVLFVTLNSLIPKGKFGYSEIYPEKDLAFLENILTHKDPDQLLVINQHVPLGMIENKDDFLSLLSEQEQVLILAGHTHTAYQNFRKREGLSTIHELTAGAVSGHWWTGEKDWQGVPLALMRDGTPRGYFELTFSQEENQTKYEIIYKGVGLDRSQQMSIWLGELQTEISHIIDPENPLIYVNFYAGSRKSKVDFRVDNGPWIKMDHIRMTDPYVNRIRLLQQEDLLPNGVSRKSPYRNQSSSHIFKGVIPLEYTGRPVYLEVRAIDPYGTNHIEGRWIDVNQL